MATPHEGEKPTHLQSNPVAAKKAAGVAVSVKAQPDWERIELEYRAGIKTLRQIADENGITHGAINKRAKRDGWERDLSAKIHAKADALVSRAVVSSQVSKEATIAEKQVVDANAHAVAEVRLAHRRDIHRARKLTNSLLDELEKQTDPDTLAMLNELGEILRAPDNNGVDRLHELYQKIISLPERARTMKTLAESLQKLVDMERAAFGMDAKAQPDDGQRSTKTLNDAERAIRLAAILNSSASAGALLVALQAKKVGQ